MAGINDVGDDGRLVPTVMMAGISAGWQGLAQAQIMAMMAGGASHIVWPGV